VAARYEVKYTEDAGNDLRGLRNYDQVTIAAAVNQHLFFAPTVETKSSVKKLKQPFWSQYRLRAGNFRVYYDVNQATNRVTILRVFEKGTEVTPTAPA